MISAEVSKPQGGGLRWATRGVSASSTTLKSYNVPLSLRGGQFGTTGLLTEEYQKVNATVFLQILYCYNCYAQHVETAVECLM